MTRDDIIRMAQEADDLTDAELGSEWNPDRENLRDIHFAALVAAEKDKEIAELREERRRDMEEIYSLRESEESLREENERLREALTVAAKAELYDPATGIVDADVLAIVQATARAALRREGI